MERDFPAGITMADGGEKGSSVGKFHSTCGTGVELSDERRIASCGKNFSTFSFSHEQIPIGLDFSVNILKATFFVSYYDRYIVSCLFLVYCDWGRR